MGSPDDEARLPSPETRYAERGSNAPRIGRGVFGEATLVFDRLLGREMARKELRAEEPGEPLPDRSAAAAAPGETQQGPDETTVRARERFIAEARLTARLEHPSIVPLYDLGLDGQDRPFYTMQPVRGQTLAEAIPGRGPPGGPPEIGPIGSPRWMRPEVAHGPACDERSDVLSLGTILHHILTGHPPSAAQSPTASLHAARPRRWPHHLPVDPRRGGLRTRRGEGPGDEHRRRPVRDPARRRLPSPGQTGGPIGERALLSRWAGPRPGERSGHRAPPERGSGADPAARRPTEGHRGPAFAAEGRWLIPAGWQGRSQVHHTRDGRLPAVWQAHASRNGDPALAPDARRVSTVSADRSVRTWNLDPLDPAASAQPGWQQTREGRRLAPDEDQ